MLSDPISVTFDGSAKSLVRVSQGSDSSIYRTSDGEFTLFLSESTFSDGMVRHEVIMEHRYPDPTPDAFSGGPGWQSNRVGLTFEVNPNRFYSSTEIPLLRTALLALVDSTLQGRIIAGEK